MGSYYKHTRRRDTKIPYSFQCESCMQNSGDLLAHFVGDEATYNSNFKTLSEDKVEKLEKQAYDNLVRKVKEAHKDATEKDIYWTEFKDKCPHCNKSQSWAIAGLKKKRFDTPIVIFLVGVIICVVALVAHYFSDTTDVPLPVAFGALGIATICAIVVLIWNTIRINLKIKETSSSGTKNIPNIDWSKVEDLLDEQ